jgi:hypothetical protein
MSSNPFVGTWTYRSLYNDPDGNTTFDDLQFGEGTLVIDEAPDAELAGKIGGDGWSLTLRGSRGYGSPMQARFQGTGVVSGEEWVYDYLGWLVPRWPNGVDEFERQAMVGSVIRTVQHKSGSGGVSPAGFVGSFYAVRVD